MALIELKNIKKAYGRGESVVEALKDINLFIEEGEFLAIMGPSGSGKSTLLNILGGLDRPSSGSYKLAGEAVEEKGDADLAHLRSRKVGFVFQTFNLIPRLSVLRNVELPMVYAGVPPTERQERAMTALKAVGLHGKADRTPDQLSGGEIQRVSIARALVNNPDIILADEPTGNLDSKTGKDILDVLTNLNREGRTIILVTHNPENAKYAKRRLLMTDGAVKEEEEAA
ncbi:MAG: ABC transporter ATP-binding protein [Candidatus Aquicultorales bacterium]